MARKPKTLLGKLFAPFGSYWLAVTLLVNLFLLTWLGTLEQVEKGIHWVQEEYFESYFVWAKAGAVRLVLPGGYLTLGLLTVNLVVGGLVRIRKSRRTIGVITAHIGIALMLIGGLIEHKASTYGFVELELEESKDQFMEYAGWEIVIWDASQTSGVTEYTIPSEDFDDLAGSKRRRFERDELPFDLVLSHYMLNSEPVRAVNVGRPDAPVIDSLFLRELPREKEEEHDITGVYATAVYDSGASTSDNFLWGRIPLPWTVEAGGKTWAIMMRRKAHDMPFAVRLKKFTKDDHPGTPMARSFSSDVIRIDDDGAEIPVHIRMNEPLRAGGLVVYQQGYNQSRKFPGQYTSTLAVSKNPSDRMPWVAVSIIALGLLWTFMDRLFGYLRKQKSRNARAMPVPEDVKKEQAA